MNLQYVTHFVAVALNVAFFFYTNDAAWRTHFSCSSVARSDSSSLLQSCSEFSSPLYEALNAVHSFCKHLGQTLKCGIIWNSGCFSAFSKVMFVVPFPVLEYSTYHSSFCLPSSWSILNNLFIIQK
jgi:hypothetical protein